MEALFKFALKTVLAIVIVSKLFDSQSLAKDSHDENHNFYDKKFEDAHKWSKVFDDPQRDKWQKPELVIENLNLADCKAIADIGAGTGYFSLRIAKKYPSLKVYAVDTQASMIEYLKELAKKNNLNNLIPVLSENNCISINDKLDRVLIVDTFHHIPNRVDYLIDLKKLLCQNAIVVNIDFNQQSPVGPPKKHRLSQKIVTSEFEKAGFTKYEELNFLPNQYFLEYKIK